MLGWTAAGRQGGIAWPAARNGFARAVETIDRLSQELATYPRWLVALILSTLVVVVVWVGVKLLKLTLYVAAALLTAVALTGIVLWWLE